MIRRKREEEEHENHERWLVSYADFITLLFAFFVVMYAISSVNDKKYKKLSESINNAFSSTPPVISKPMDDQDSAAATSGGKSLIKPLPLAQLHYQKLQMERESMTRLGMNLSDKLSPMIQEGKVRVFQNNRGLRIDINDNLLFASGSAELNPGASEILGKIARMLVENDRAIQVEGHTDNTPIHSSLFYSNWELSAVRASSVVRMLSSQGIEETRLSALGFGSTQAIGNNASAEGKAKNRRVSIMVLYDTLNFDQNQGTEISPRPLR